VNLAAFLSDSSGLFYWFTFFYKSDEHKIDVERYLKQDMQGAFAPNPAEEKKTTP
jgi:hypothetical protein